MASCRECDFGLIDLVDSGEDEGLFDCVYDESGWGLASTQVLAAVDVIATSVVAAETRAITSRPQEVEWSAIEYACHVRDVLLCQRERVLRALRGYGHEWVAMGRDERAIHDGYQSQHAADVAVQLRQAAKMWVNLLGRLNIDDWDLTIAYMFPGGQARSIRWVAVHTAHEAVHHQADVARVLSAAR